MTPGVFIRDPTKGTDIHFTLIENLSMNISQISLCITCAAAINLSTAISYEHALTVILSEYKSLRFELVAICTSKVYVFIEIKAPLTRALRLVRRC